MHKAEMTEGSIVVSTRLGVWPSRLNLPRTEPTDFVREIREYLERKQLLSCTVPEGERIVRLEFGSKESRVFCYVEVFGGGNVIVTDEENMVVAIMKGAGLKRNLQLGSRYELPPSRGIPVSKLTPRDILDILNGESPYSGERKSLSLPARILNEAVHRAKRHQTNGEEGSVVFASHVIDELESIQNEARIAQRFYLYSEGKNRYLSAVLLSHLPPPIEAFDWTALEARLSEEVTTMSMMESASASLAKIKKEERRIENAKEMLRKTKERAEALEKLANGLKSGSLDINEVSGEVNLLSSDLKKEEVGWTYRGRRTEFASSYSLASKLYEEAKNLKASTKPLEDSITQMNQNLQRMRVDVESGRRAASATGEEKRRNKLWFEAYRWFVTSGGYLAVGGRDAGSNSLLIRRRLEPSDLVFHTEAAGSPFFIIKRGTECAEQDLRQTAQATVSYSRAWREGLTAADAYCVLPGQVRLGAPAGTFMPKGSFMIVGERRYFKGIRLQLGVGLTKLAGEVVPCSGPVDAIMSYCSVVVEITPGHLQPGVAAKKIRGLLLDHYPGMIENISLDDVTRCLPAGKTSTGRIIKGEGKPFKEDLW